MAEDFELEIHRLDKAIVAKEWAIKQLERTLEREKLNNEKFIKRAERKCSEQRAIFAKENDSKNTKTAAIKKVRDAIRDMSIEISRIEETLSRYDRYKTVLLKLSPPEWRKEGLYFTDPQQVLDVIEELREESLSIIKNSNRLAEMEEVLQKDIDSASRTMKEEEGKLLAQIQCVKENAKKRKRHAINLKQTVHRYESFKNEDEERMWDSVSKKVDDVYRACVNVKGSDMSTTEKMACIENRVTKLLNKIERIPEKIVNALRNDKNNYRQRQDKERRDREREEARLRRELQRTMNERRSCPTRTLRPRYFHGAQDVHLTVNQDEEHMEQDKFYATEIFPLPSKQDSRVEAKPSVEKKGVTMASDDTDSSATHQQPPPTPEAPLPGSSSLPLPIPDCHTLPILPAVKTRKVGPQRTPPSAVELETWSCLPPVLFSPFVPCSRWYSHPPLFVPVVISNRQKVTIASKAKLKDCSDPEIQHEST